jgi:hypothetical protein
MQRITKLSNTDRALLLFAGRARTPQLLVAPCHTTHLPHLDQFADRDRFGNRAAKQLLLDAAVPWTSTAEDVG